MITELKKDFFMAELANKYSINFLEKFFEIQNAEVFVFGGAIRDIVLEKEWKEADMRVVLPVDYSERQVLIEKALEGIEIQEKVILENLDLIVYRFLPEGSTTDYAIDLSIVPNMETNIPDFTVNSLFYDLRRGVLVDRYGGMKDLQDKMLRTCSDPYKEFAERNNEIFRAVKAVCKDGLTIHPETMAALKESAPLAMNVLNLVKDQRSGLLVELFQSDIFRGLKYDAKKYVELFIEIGLIPVMLEFLSREIPGDIQLPYTNPFHSMEVVSFENGISIFLSSIARLYPQNPVETFTQMKKVFALDEPKKYTDFVVDIAQIIYID